MDDNFKLRAVLKTDEELHSCIDNREKYLPETVEAAVAELQHRGVEFSDEELKVISEDMQARREIAEAGTGIFGVFNTNWDNNMVDDPEAPAMFSKRVIFAFSVLFSVFFGSILLAINVSKTKHRGNMVLVLLYGFGFTIAQGLFLRAYTLNPILSLASSIAGAYIMDNLFWNRYVGNSTLYRSRPIWVPLIIGIAIVVAYLLMAKSLGALPV
ncbi:MAG: hypothetical protein M3N14_04455 [Bacteroidota bacterium]|nr:hypothetical protein [Bacteroidota bacterium]